MTGRAAGETRPAQDRSRRRRARRRGARSEWLAVLVLVLKGYRILARNYLVAGGEIDIVACRGEVVAFVEVKARVDLETARLALTPQKRRRVERAAAVWLARNGWAVNRVLRGDAILVLPRRWPRHVPDAFPLRIG